MQQNTHITLSSDIEQIGDVVFACNDQRVLCSGVTTTQKLRMTRLWIIQEVVVGLSSLQCAVDKHQIPLTGHFGLGHKLCN